MSIIKTVNTFQAQQPSSVKKYFFLLLLASVALCVVELAGVGGFLPFLQVLSNPEVIYQNKYLLFLNDLFGSSSEKKFQMQLGGILLLLLIIKNASNAIMIYWKNKFGEKIYNELSPRILKHCLFKPYNFYFVNNSSVLTKNIIEDVEFLRMFALQVVSLITEIILFLILIVFLLLVDYRLTLFCVAGALICLGGLIFFANRHLKKVTKRVSSVRERMFKIATESLSGVQEIKVLGCENYFISTYRDAVRKYSHNFVMYIFFRSFPGIGLQSLAYTGLFLVIFYLMSSYDSFNHFILKRSASFYKFPLSCPVDFVYQTFELLHKNYLSFFP